MLIINRVLPFFTVLSLNKIQYLKKKRIWYRMSLKDWLWIGGEKKKTAAGAAAGKNDRLLSFDSIDVFEDTLSITDTRSAAYGC